MRARALPPLREHACEIVPARFGEEAGMLGAAALALEPRAARRGVAVPAEGRMAGRLVVCPTPIGNLEDVTLRVL